MPEAGQNLSHYRLVEKIGEGGMGVVWRAEDTVLRRSVALKFLPDGFDRDPERLSRFEREARFLASLSHPNIAAIHGLEQADGERFLVMELAPGESLDRRLRKGRLPVDESLKLGCEIAKALEAAHEKGVIHRDLKPGDKTSRQTGDRRDGPGPIPLPGLRSRPSSCESPQLQVVRNWLGELKRKMAVEQ